MSSNPSTNDSSNGVVTGEEAGMESTTMTSSASSSSENASIAAAGATSNMEGDNENPTRTRTSSNNGEGNRVMFGPEPPPGHTPAQQQQQQQRVKQIVRVRLRPAPSDNNVTSPSASQAATGSSNNASNETIRNTTSTSTAAGGQPQQVRIHIRRADASTTTNNNNNTAGTNNATSASQTAASSNERTAQSPSTANSSPAANEESQRAAHHAMNVINTPQVQAALARHSRRMLHQPQNLRAENQEVEHEGGENDTVAVAGGGGVNVHIQSHPPGYRHPSMHMLPLPFPPPPPHVVAAGIPTNIPPPQPPPPFQQIPIPPPQQVIMRTQRGGNQYRIGIPPLMAQPVPYSHQDVDGKEEEEEKKGRGSREEKKESGRGALECSICFEYMEDPVGCGHCQQRFCHSCLKRVLSEEAARRIFNPLQRPLAPPPPQPPHLWPPDLNAKCPCCRSTFTPKDVIHDTELQKRISTNSDLITCPFPGCNERMTLNRVREHEANCPHMRMRCRYAPFGCTWVGPKRDLEKHDEEECAFAKLGGFVDLFRQMKVEHAHAIGHLQQQVASSNRLIHIQNNTIMMLQSRNPANLLDVLHLTYIVTCHPVRFLVTKDLWRLMYRTPEARAIVHNVLYMFPSFLLVARIFFTGVRHLLVLEYNGLSQHDDYIDSLDTILLSFSLTIIGVLNLVCFHLDDSSPIEWTKFHLRPGFSWPVVRDTSAVALAALHCACVEFDGDRTGVLVWFAVFIAATCMPRVVSAMLSRAASGNDSDGDNNDDDDETNESQHVSETRARSVVLFGIRYGFITEVCGILSTLDAILVLRLAKSLFKLEERFTAESSECFLAELNARVLGCIAVARVAMIIATMSIIDVHDTAISILFALGLLMVVNRIMNGLNLTGDYLGRRVSKAAASTAASMSRPGFELRNAEKRMDGMATFCTWLTFLGCIILG